MPKIVDEVGGEDAEFHIFKDRFDGTCHQQTAILDHKPTSESHCTSWSTIVISLNSRFWLEQLEGVWYESKHTI